MKGERHYKSRLATSESNFTINQMAISWMNNFIVKLDSDVVRDIWFMDEVG